jgi:hypothetical protein
MALMGPLFLPAKYVRSECQAPVVTGVSPVDAARDGGYYRREKVSEPRHDPLWVMGVIGLSLVLVFSLIDLPFRCPAILCTWVVILAALPRATEKENRVQGSGFRKPAEAGDHQTSETIA